MTDLVTNGDDSTASKVDSLYYRLNTGRGFAPPVAMGVNRPLLKSSFQAAEVVDSNGDGRDELLIPVPSGAISAGQPQFSRMDLVQGQFGPSGTLTFTVKTTPIGFSLRKIEDLSAEGLRILDADGDGNDDVLVVDRPTLSPGPTFTLFRHASGHKADMLIQIKQRDKSFVDSRKILPISTRIRYAPLTDADVYTRGDCPRIALTTCLAGPMYVVRSTRQNAGLTGEGAGNDMVTEYRYVKGRVDKKSRSLLGFAERIAKSHATGSDMPPTTVRSFYSNSESTRDPRLVERWTYTTLPITKQHLVREQLVWAEQPTSPGTYFSYASPIQQDLFEFSPFCGGDCLSTLPPAQFNALSLKPFERHGNVIESVDVFGNTTKRSVTNYSFDANGFIMTENATTTSTSYDIDVDQWLLSRSKKVSVTDHTQGNGPGSAMSRTRVDEYTYPTGLVRPIQHKTSSSSNTVVLTTDLTYDGWGNVIQRKLTDSVTGTVRETASIFDPLGFPHAVINALGHTSYTGYDPRLGKVKVLVDENSLRTDISYDSLGNKTITILPGGVTKNITYKLEEVGNEWLLRARSTDTSGALSEVVVDRAGRPVLERFKGFDGAMRVKTRTYFPQGWLQSETVYRRADASGKPEQTTYAYDSRGRMTFAIDPNNSGRRWAYDKAQTTYTNARGFKKVWTRDALGQTLRMVDGVGTSDESARRHIYGPFGTLISSQTEGIDASRSTFEYDERGLLLSREDKERGKALYQYNAFGSPIVMRDANGRETTWVYDLLGRISQRVVKQNNVQRSKIEHTYDAVDGRTKRGQLLRLEFQDGPAGSQIHRIDNFYDSLSRLFRQEQRLPSDVLLTEQDSFVVLFDHDSLNRLSAVQYPKIPGQPFGTRAVYEYSSADTGNGRLQRVRVDDPLESDITVWEALATDGQDRLMTDRSGDGVETRRAFDWRGLASTVSMSKGTITLLAEQYSYDVEGNLIARERIDGDTDPVERFQYDALDRLTAATHGAFSTPSDTWSYDKLGNLTASLRRGAYTYDPQRPTQVVSVKGGLFSDRAFTYDAIGNQITRPEGNVAYNDFDLPTKMASARGDVAVTLLYTGTGERARKITKEETITYVPGLYERHHKADGIEHRLRIQAGNRDIATLVYRQQPSAAPTREPIRYVHAERQGSTMLVTSGDGQSKTKPVILESRSYDAFGQVRNPNWSGAFQDNIAPAVVGQGYTGHDDDREFGLVNMKGRVYDAELGRFLTPDPNVNGANTSQAWNRYTYVSNNPLRHTDPTGFVGCAGCEEFIVLGAAYSSGGPGAYALATNDTLVREAERYERDEIERVKAAAKQKQEQERKKQQEAYALGQQPAKEAAAKLGGVGGRSSALGPGALAMNDVCDPNTSCETTIADYGCIEGTSCSDQLASKGPPNNEIPCPSATSCENQVQSDDLETVPYTVKGLPSMNGYLIGGYGNGAGLSLGSGFSFAFDVSIEAYSGLVSDKPYVQFSVFGNIYLPRGKISGGWSPFTHDNPEVKYFGYTNYTSMTGLNYRHRNEGASEYNELVGQAGGFILGVGKRANGNP